MWGPSATWCTTVRAKLGIWAVSKSQLPHLQRDTSGQFFSKKYTHILLIPLRLDKHHKNTISLKLFCCSFYQFPPTKDPHWIKNTSILLPPTTRQNHNIVYCLARGQINLPLPSPRHLPLQNPLRYHASNC